MNDTTNKTALRRFFRNLISLMSPETFMLGIGPLTLHFATVLLFPATFLSTSAGGQRLPAQPAVANLGQNWGYVMLFVGILNLVAGLWSLAAEKRPHRWLYATSVCDALLYSYIPLTLYQMGVPFNVFKIYVLHSVASVFFCLFIKARERNEVERDAGECVACEDGTISCPGEIVSTVAKYHERRKNGESAEQIENTVAVPDWLKEVGRAVDGPLKPV